MNPNAGFLRNKRLDPGEPARILGDSDLVTVTQDLDHLGALVRRLCASGVRTVAVLGGDGTVLRVCSEFASAGAGLPTVFPIGGGTSNALLTELQLSARPVARLQRLAEVLSGAAPTAMERNTLRVNGRMGFSFAVGYLRNASAFYESHPVDGIWPLVVTLKLLKGLILRHPAILRFLDNVPATIHYDDTPLPLDGFNFAYLSTITQNGLKLNMTPSASGAADQFEALFATLTVGELLGAFSRMTLGGEMNAPRQERRLVRKVRIEPLAPIPWFMDGEHFEPANPIAVELGPKLRLLG
ncbi:MAG TPA: diacylglycerol kinase family protein [Polyangiaceae bacterium]|nr:diacylglycerol kinase family protein [Polyangiaceae bacterium]HMR79672.1 diacylglycerol kinase family protein [Polyangiaceae bacterium]